MVWLISLLYSGLVGLSVGRWLSVRAFEFMPIKKKKRIYINFQLGYYHNKHLDELLLKPYWEVGHVAYQCTDISSNSGNSTQHGTIN